ncbi:MAG: hypothetical protein R3B91_17240 [Planctomycetaceae bacterium]
MAMQIAWILLAAKEPVNGLAAAADRDEQTSSIGPFAGWQN